MSDDRERGSVVRLVTKVEAEREASEAAEANSITEAQEACLKALERAAELVKSNPASCVAIAVAFQDGSFGSVIPFHPPNVGLLIGAISYMEFRLNLRNNVDLFDGESGG